MTPGRVITSSAEQIRTIFLTFGFARVRETEILITKRGDNTARGGRTVGSTRADGLLMHLSPTLADLPSTTRMAIIAHEFGHAADFLYPGVWLDDGASPPDRARWEARDADAIELAADQIAEAATGLAIGYGGGRLLQSFSCGVRPRPTDLGPFGPGTLR